jgi:hypothetical protein
MTYYSLKKIEPNMKPVIVYRHCVENAIDIETFWVSKLDNHSKLGWADFKYNRTVWHFLALNEQLRARPSSIREARVIYPKGLLLF